MAISVRKTFLFLFCTWLIISSCYYADTLFTGSFAVAYDEGLYHKIIKYLACAFISLALCSLGRAYFLLYWCAVLVFLAATMVVVFGYYFNLSVLSILIVAIMLPFILVLDVFKRDVTLINLVIIFSGVVVGGVSVVELTVLAPVMEPYWAATGGVRSIATLYNPNNLGLYAGVCLILLFFQPMHKLYKVVALGLILVSFVSSGSRTAWISLFFTLLCIIFYNPNVIQDAFRAIERRAILLGFAALLSVSSLFIIIPTSDGVGVEDDLRGTNLYTASVRLDNFYRYVQSLDVDILLPDILGARENYIQDNFYLTLLNSFGLIGLFLLVFSMAAIFNISAVESSKKNPWFYILLFYLVSGLGGSQLNSFPNNQLFFLSLGSVLVVKRFRISSFK